MTSLKVRIASSPEDVRTAQRLRYEVYYEAWGIAFPVDEKERLLGDELDAVATILLGEVDGVVVSTARLCFGVDGTLNDEHRHEYDLDRLQTLVPLSRIAVGDRFAVRPTPQRAEWSSAMQAALVGHLFSRDVDILLCMAEPHLLARYRQIGLRPYGHLVSLSVALVVPLIGLYRDRAFLEENRCETILPQIPAHFPRTCEPALLALTTERPPASAADLRTPALQGHSLFDGVPADALQRLSAGAYVLNLPGGVTLARQERQTKTLYVVLSGEIAVHAHDEDVARVGPGQVVGEIAFLLDVPRTADLVATCDTSVLALSAGDLARLIRNEPQLMARLMFNLARMVAAKIVTPAQLSEGHAEESAAS